VKKLNIILVVVILAGAVLLSTMGSKSVQGLQAVWLTLVSPFLQTSSAVSEQLGTVGQSLKTLDQLESENRELTLKNRELMATNQLLRDIEAENNKLRMALDYKERSVFALMPARVISRDASTWWNTVKVNRGFEDGVESDMPVLTESGLVGKTTTVSKNISTVLLLTDETCRVAARVEGTVEQGIASGHRVPGAGTAGEIQLSFLSKSANLQPGQKVYTAGVSGGVFPSGIMIGTVKSFRARALDGQSLLEPAVDLAGVEDVFILVGAK
jgi:rod shape-determining protein MreC